MSSENLRSQQLLDEAASLSGYLRMFLTFLFGLFVVFFVGIFAFGQGTFQISRATSLFDILAFAAFLAGVVSFFFAYKLLNHFSYGEFFSLTTARYFRFIAWTTLAFLVIDIAMQLQSGDVNIDIGSAFVPILLFPISRIWRYEAERQTS